MSKHLLFVTYLSKGFESGFNYCTELARLLEHDISVLIVRQKGKFSEKMDNLLTETAFAEADEHEAALEFCASDVDDMDFSNKIAFLKKRSGVMEIGMSIFHSMQNVITAVETLLKQKKGIDIVMLGTTVTERGDMTSNKLNRLLKSVSRPIVTIENKASPVNESPESSENQKLNWN